MDEFSDIKRQELKKQRAYLIEEYQAAQQQLGEVLTAVERKRLGRQITRLEQEIQQLEQQIADSMPCIDNANLETTMSNPHFAHDLFKLQHSWEIEKVIGPATIILVTGCSVIAELLDRPIAEFLRDEIDSRGNPRFYQRGIIVSDLWWFRDPALHTQPVISIGGHAINHLTSELVKENLTWSEKIENCNQIASRPPQLAVWGETVSETQDQVSRFIQDSCGLSAFLALCWQPMQSETALL